jgi:hypothetical protein
MHKTMLDGLIVIEDGDAGDDQHAYLDLAVEAIESVKPDFPWSGLLKGTVTVRFVDNIGEGDSFAEGKWVSSKRLVKIERVRKDGHPARNKVRYYTLHELGHAIDGDSMGDANHQDAMALMDPKPEGWRNTKGLHDYWGLPSESFANRLVEAIITSANPHSIESMYDDDYQRKISGEELDDLYAIIVKGEAGDGDGEEGPAEPTEPPSAAELQARIDAAFTILDPLPAQLVHVVEEVEEALDTLHPPAKK